MSREYVASAVSTDTFGRTICRVRDHMFVVDGPVPNGAPGVAITPSEVFLSALASCAVELIQVVARAEERPLAAVSARAQGTITPGSRHHPEVTLYDSIELDITLEGVSREDADQLVEAFKAR